MMWFSFQNKGRNSYFKPVTFKLTIFTSIFWAAEEKRIDRLLWIKRLIHSFIISWNLLNMLFSNGLKKSSSYIWFSSTGSECSNRAESAFHVGEEIPFFHLFFLFYSTKKGDFDIIVTKNDGAFLLSGNFVWLQSKIIARMTIETNSLIQNWSFWCCCFPFPFAHLRW